MAQLRMIEESSLCVIEERISHAEGRGGLTRRRGGAEEYREEVMRAGRDWAVCLFSA